MRGRCYSVSMSSLLLRAPLAHPTLRGALSVLAQALLGCVGAAWVSVTLVRPERLPSPPHTHTPSLSSNSPPPPARVAQVLVHEAAA